MKDRPFPTTPPTTTFQKLIFACVGVLWIISLSATALGAPPANDDFSNAALLTGSFDTASSSTREATREAGEPAASGETATVWFRWVAPDSGRISVQVLSDDGLYDKWLRIWGGTDFGNLRSLAAIHDLSGDMDLYNFPVASGQSYYFSVGMDTDSLWDRGDFDLAVVLHTNTDINSLDVLGAPFDNDVFSRAYTVGPSGGTVISYGYDTVVREPGEPVHNLNRTTWYKFIAPADGRLTASTTGSDIHNPEDNERHYYVWADKSLIAYEVESFSEMITASPVDYSIVSSGLPGQLDFAVTEGETYYVSTGVADNTTEVRGYAWRVMTFGFTATIAPPTVTTDPVSSITANSAMAGGEVTGESGAPVIERGVVFSTHWLPSTSSGTKVVSGSGTGVFSSTLTGLSPSTTYAVRAYATNSEGTGYGPQVSFTTDGTGSTTSVTPAAAYAAARAAQISTLSRQMKKFRKKWKKAKKAGKTKKARKLKKKFKKRRKQLKRV